MTDDQKAFEVHRLADDFVPRFEPIFKASVERLRERATDALIEADYARGLAEPKSLFALVDRMTLAKETAHESEERVYSEILVGGAKLEGIDLDVHSPWVGQAARTLTANLVTGVNAETKRAIRQVIFEAIRDGEPPKVAAKRIRQIVGLTHRDAVAVRRLAESGARQGAVDRYATKLLNRRSLNVARTECLPGSTIVDAAVVGAVHRRWYEGEMIEVQTASGGKFTATPNHPMLTQAGWLPLHEVAEGDDLLCDARLKDLGTAGYQNEAHEPAALHEVFRAVAVGGVSESVSAGCGDFHGDGREGYVDVVRPHGVLRYGSFVPIGEPITNCLFSEPDKAALASGHPSRSRRAVDQTVGGGTRAFLGSGITEGTTDCVMGRVVTAYEVTNRSPTLVGAGDVSDWEVCTEPDVERPLGPVKACDLSALRKVVVAGLAERPDYAFLQKNASDAGPRHPDLLGGLFDAQSVEVQRDKVIASRRIRWSGHVFNLSTPTGYFVAGGGFYTGNTIRASARGQQLAWQEMARDNLIDTSRMRQRWVVTRDDRLCPRCSPMHDQKVSLGSQFTERERGVLPSERVPVGGVAVGSPPLHPQCRCVLVADFG